jgi:ferrous iron transport protein B
MVHTKTSNKSLLEKASDLRWEMGEDLHDSLMVSIYQDAVKIRDKVVHKSDGKIYFSWDQRLDKILTGRFTGFPIMLLLLMGVFWITIAGANVPSGLIASLLIDSIHPALKSFSANLGLIWWLDGLLIDGIYLAVAWVISVMLPPMAIFFPLFTILEDFGYLPRVAFNLDSLFKKAGAHGKQALTMAMGYGCNAAGIIATRIIDSPRERLIAIITNNFALCNGRWPTQILIATLFIGSLVPSALAGFVSASAVVVVALLGVLFTFVTSWGLSKTVLKGEASAFSLELPPYRPPRILNTLYTSLIDRTIFVLWRAVVFAIPAGALIWLLANINIGQLSLAEHFMNFSNPFALLIGLNGVILLAYIIAIPANEIVVPTILMLTVLNTKIIGFGEGAGVMFELDDYIAYQQIFKAGGWTLLTAVNLMLFSLVHNPCSTTIYTIYKETGSIRWTALSTLLPIAMGLILCFIVAQLWHLLI